jgi:4-methyl-5(b-hydroxyethyl)-thiazole monophosphate biosynthesis
VTCYPGFEGHLEGGEVVDNRVVVDGKLVTSRGPATALEFALTLVGLLRDVEMVRWVGDSMLAV